MKAAVTSLTRTLAVELAPDNIRVNTIAPDYIATPGLDSPVGQAGTANEDTAALQHRIATPMGRIGTFEDAGGCALFLASNLSSFVTGSTLHPDGGALASAGWFNWPNGGLLEPSAPRRPGPPARRMTGWASGPSETREPAAEAQDCRRAHRVIADVGEDLVGEAAEAVQGSPWWTPRASPGPGRFPDRPAGAGRPAPRRPPA